MMEKENQADDAPLNTELRVWIKKETAAKIAAHAKAEHTSESVIVEVALSWYLKQMQQDK